MKIATNPIKTGLLKANMVKKPITNQRTPKEIKEIVEEVDKTIPDGEKFVEIMEGQPSTTVTEDQPAAVTEDTQPIVEDAPSEDGLDITPEPEVESEPVPEPKKELPPIEERYREAGQEAMVLNSKLGKVAETVEEAEVLPEPTIEELKIYAKQMGEDYDNLDTFAQNMLKENLQNKKRFGKIKDLFVDEKRANEWIKKVEDFVDMESTTQTYPELESVRDDFIRYCSKKSHVGADLELLIAGFMWKQPIKRPVQGSILLPSGKGGVGQPKSTKPTELTEDDAMIYRQKDPKKYKQLIKQKKFRPTI